MEIYLYYEAELKKFLGLNDIGLLDLDLLVETSISDAAAWAMPLRLSFKAPYKELTP